MRWTIAASTLVLLASCTGKGPQAEQNAAEAEPPGPVLPPIGARVLLREERGLASEPKHDADRMVAPGTREELRIAEVVAYVGEFVELRSITETPAKVCSAGGTDLSIELHFFALPEEFERVLGQPKRLEFDDGTKIEFAAGVPILGEGLDTALRVGAAEFAVPLADDEIATWFRAAPFDEPLGFVWWPFGQPLHYGEQQITNTTDLFVAAHAKRAIEGGTLLDFVNACGRFVLRTDIVLTDGQRSLYSMKGPKDAIPAMARNFDPDMVARNAGILGVTQQDVDHSLAVPYGTECEPQVRWTAPAKTDLQWQATGTPAGVVFRGLVLPSDATELDGKVCFAVTGFNVCIETSQLQRQEEQCRAQGLGRSFAGDGKRVPQVEQAPG